MRVIRFYVSSTPPPSSFLRRTSTASAWSHCSRKDVPKKSIQWVAAPSSLSFVIVYPCYDILILRECPLHCFEFSENNFLRVIPKLTFYLAYFLTFYLAFFIAFLLAFYLTYFLIFNYLALFLAVYLTYMRTVYLAHGLKCIVTFSCKLSHSNLHSIWHISIWHICWHFCLANILTCILKFSPGFYLTFYFAFYLTFSLTFYVTCNLSDIYSGILSDIYADFLSDMHSDMYPEFLCGTNNDILLRNLSAI